MEKSSLMLSHWSQFLTKKVILLFQVDGGLHQNPDGTYEGGGGANVNTFVIPYKFGLSV